MNRSRVWVSGLCATGLAVGLMSTSAIVRAQDAKAGKVDAEALYKEKCAVCHGADGNSPLPHMSFVAKEGTWLHGSTVKEVTHTITEGVPGTAMVSWKAAGLTDEQIAALAKYVRHFDPKLPADKGAGKGKKTS
jgi:cytochrome c oxidase cbb3-type subunit III